MPAAELIAPLFDGPIDIVGDVHGEIDALAALMRVLGYDAHGEHPEQRRLVFLGDLCDRGPDSPAVIELVRTLVGRGLAQCVLGNHELNLLRGASKEGNRWFIDPTHPEQQGDFAASKPALPERKAGWAEFFVTLPLALERHDLRVIHAAWHAPSIDTLRGDGRRSIEVFDDFAARAKAELVSSGLAERADEERSRFAGAIFDAAAVVPLLPNLGLKDEHYQMSNPIRIVTSGLERVTDTPFWAGGKWRMCDRLKWWDEYQDPTPVIVGHYWRRARLGPDVSDGKPDMFAPARYDAWQGARGNVYCVDFSVGGRYRERQRNISPFATHLAAVRWPEREVVFEDGRRSALSGA